MSDIAVNADNFARAETLRMFAALADQEQRGRRQALGASLR